MNSNRSRRRILQSLGAGTAVGLAGCAGLLDEESEPADVPDDVSDVEEDVLEGPLNVISEQRTFNADIPDRIGIEPFAEGLEQPTSIAFVPDSEIAYIGDRVGTILIHDEAGLYEQPALDYTSVVQLGGERGLVGLALHPAFETNRRLFVRYSGELRDDMPPDYSHAFVLSEFEVSEDLRTIDPDSERIVMEFGQPHENHNAGDIAFGPDRYLYVTSGDGGGSNDLAPDHPTDWYDENDGGNGQDTSEFLLGGLLRIDVDDVPDGEGYGIPPDNPLAELEGHLDEYYAWGMRNPWQLSFDGDDIYIGDVGQAQWEWVNKVEKGGNYGWNVTEGSHCFDDSDRWNTEDGCPDHTPADVRDGEPIEDPVLEYPNNRNIQLDTDEYESGVAVMGGYMYRGSAIPALEGLYVFSDMQVAGRLFIGQPLDEYERKPWPMTTLPLTADAAETLGEVVAFGEDNAGELYVLGSGGVYRLIPDGE